MRKLESELEQQHKKLQEVKRKRTELHNKVLSDKRDSQVSFMINNEASKLEHAVVNA